MSVCYSIRNFERGHISRPLSKGNVTKVNGLSDSGRSGLELGILKGTHFKVIKQRHQGHLVLKMP